MPTQIDCTNRWPLDAAGTANTGLPFVGASKDEPVAVEIRIDDRLGRAMRPTEALHLSREELWRKADLCASALAEARSHATAGRFGTACGQLLDRVAEILDEMDEILIGLNPRRDHDSFVRAAELHRELEEIQSLTPREYRGIQRRRITCAHTSTAIIPHEPADDLAPRY